MTNKSDVTNALAILSIFLSFNVGAIALTAFFPAPVHAMEDGIQEPLPPMPPPFCRTNPTHPQCGNTN